MGGVIRWRATPFRILALTSVLVLSATVASANPNGEQICQRMISEGRNGGMSLADCLCTHRVAVAVLDEDVQALLFDAWYTGANNMAAIERLPNPGRIERQFRTMERTLEANCG